MHINRNSVTTSNHPPQSTKFPLFAANYKASLLIKLHNISKQPKTAISKLGNVYCMFEMCILLHNGFTHGQVSCKWKPLNLIA